MSTNCVTVPLLQAGVVNKNRTVISEKIIRDNLTKAQFNVLKRFCWINNNSIYGLYPRGSGGGHLIIPSTIHLLYEQSGMRVKEIANTVKDGRIDFDALYESIMFKNKYYNKYKIYLITCIDDYPIYFLGSYSHLKYHINFRDLRVGVSSDFKYRSNKSSSKRCKLVQK